MNARNLRSKGMTQGVLDYLMWHHFGRNPEERNLDLVQVYSEMLTVTFKLKRLLIFEMLLRFTSHISSVQ